MTKHQQVHIEFRGPLQDSAGDIVLRCTHDLAVRIDARGGQPVDQSLDRLAVRAFDVLVGGAHAEARAADDVTRDDVRPRHVKDVHRRTRQPSDLFGPRLRRSVLFSRRGVDRYKNPVIHGAASNFRSSRRLRRQPCPDQPAALARCASCAVRACDRRSAPAASA